MKAFLAGFAVTVSSGEIDPLAYVARAGKERKDEQLHILFFGGGGASPVSSVMDNGGLVAVGMVLLSETTPVYIDANPVTSRTCNVRPFRTATGWSGA